MSTQSRISVGAFSPPLSNHPPPTDDVAEDPNIEYPSSDGKPMAENHRQPVALAYTVSALPWCQCAPVGGNALAQCDRV